VQIHYKTEFPLSRRKSTDEERAAALDLIDATLLLHGWIMGSYLRGKPLKAAQEAQLLRFATGSAAAAKRRARSVGEGESQAIRERGDFLRDEFVPSTPYLAITAISLGVTRRLPSLTDQELVGIDEELGKVDLALGRCEKLLRAPIPLGYTRYTVRFLFLWLTLLPFALSSTFEEFGVGTWWEDKPQPVLAFAMLFVGFVFLSIEDIAVQIEEPFSILPLVKCHKVRCWLSISRLLSR
jgi:predicted membrane chloride channel (bestrophin family)